MPQAAKSHPEIDAGVHVMMVIDHAARQQLALPIRFACLTHDLGKATTSPQFLPRHPEHEARSVALVQSMSERLRIPAECRDLAVAAAGWHGKIHAALSLSADQLLALYDGCDAMRRPERFHALLDVAASDHHGRTGYAQVDYAPAPYLQAGLRCLQSLDQATIAKSVGGAAGVGNAGAIAAAIGDAKRAALQKFIAEYITHKTK